jgi:hypothetical protein
VRRRFGIDATANPLLRADGTVHFRPAPKRLSERLCQWTLWFLWLLVPVVTATVLTLAAGA